MFIFTDPTSQLGLAGATEAHWAGYNSSYAAASYAAASSFAYSGSAASGADLAGQQTAAALTDQAAAASASQIPTGMKSQNLSKNNFASFLQKTSFISQEMN